MTQKLWPLDALPIPTVDSRNILQLNHWSPLTKEDSDSEIRSPTTDDAKSCQMQVMSHPKRRLSVP